MLGFIRYDPYIGCNFLVVSTAFVVGGFREVSGLSGNLEMKTYNEGGNNGYMVQIPSEVRWPNLVLSRGVIDSNAMWSWFEDVTLGIIQRKTLTIMMLDRDRTPAMWWTVTGAIPVKWTGPTLNGMSDEVASESLELAHQGISKPFLSKTLTLLRAADDIANALSSSTASKSTAAKSTVTTSGATATSKTNNST